MVPGFYGLWKFLRGPGFSVGGQRGWLYTSFCSGNGVTDWAHQLWITSSCPHCLSSFVSSEGCQRASSKTSPTQPQPVAGQAVAHSWWRQLRGRGPGISSLTVILSKAHCLLFHRGSPPASSTSSCSLTNDVAKQTVSRDLPSSRPGTAGPTGAQYTPHSHQFPRTRKMFDKGPDQVQRHELL